jgi:selenocysteine lyase/cysteine desulfurase
MEWQGRPYLRVSIGAYNTRQDIERLTGALRALLRS